MKESSRVAGISTSLIRRMLEITAGKKNVINLSIGEPDFDTDEIIIEMACEAMRRGYTHYTSNFGLPELREAIANRYNVEMKNVMVTTGASEALLNISLAFIEERSKVIIPTPNFLSYFTYAKICKAKIVQIKTHSNNFELDPDQLNEVMDDKVSLIFLNYPNNPTGVVMDKSKLKAIVEIAQDHDAIVVSDEIYDQIYYDKKPYSLAGYENVIVVNGFSKCLAMTGWRIGFIIADEKFIDPILKVHQVNGVCAPAFAQKAVAEVLSEGIADIIIKRMVKEFRDRRDFVYKSLKKIFDVVKPEGAFYIFPNVGMDCITFTEKLLMEKGVVVTPGIAFGDGNENYVRISYSVSMGQLKEAVERIISFVSDHLPALKG